MDISGMDLKYIGDSIISSQHCQRNWDLSKEMPQEHIDLLVQAATQCPSKQNLAHYKLHVITNREIIKKIYPDCRDKRNMIRTNPQVLANLLFIFEQLIHTTPMYEEGTTNPTLLLKKDKDMSIGIASGYVALVANMLGYRTGFCACLQQNSIMETLGMTNRPQLLLGVGYYQSNLMYNVGPNIYAKNTDFSTHVKEPIDVNFIK